MYIISIPSTTTHYSSIIAEAAIDNMPINGLGYVPIKCYLQKQFAEFGQ